MVPANPRAGRLFCLHSTAESALDYGSRDRGFESCWGLAEIEGDGEKMKTEFNKRPGAEKAEDREKMIRMILRPGFNNFTYWKRIHAESMQERDKRGGR